MVFGLQNPASRRLRDCEFYLAWGALVSAMIGGLSKKRGSGSLKNETGPDPRALSINAASGRSVAHECFSRISSFASSMRSISSKCCSKATDFGLRRYRFGFLETRYLDERGKEIAR
jgi:hypothetical protein